eukprot:178575-Chlamydomonas_euryale.AAC.1
MQRAAWTNSPQGQHGLLRVWKCGVGAFAATAAAAMCHATCSVDMQPTRTCQSTDGCNKA